MSVRETGNAYNLGKEVGLRDGAEERDKLKRRLTRVRLAAVRWLDATASQRALTAHTTMKVIRATTDGETDGE